VRKKVFAVWPLGVGPVIRAKTIEVYHNTLDNLRPVAIVGRGNSW
jgi:hypothetical protein